MCGCCRKRGFLPAPSRGKGISGRWKWRPCCHICARWTIRPRTFRWPPPCMACWADFPRKRWRRSRRRIRIRALRRHAEAMRRKARRKSHETVCADFLKGWNGIGNWRRARRSMSFCGGFWPRPDIWTRCAPCLPESSALPMWRCFLQRRRTTKRSVIMDCSILSGISNGCRNTAWTSARRISPDRAARPCGS